MLLAEIALLFAVGFLPGSCDLAANALVSFACAMQVQAFRKVHGYPFASTMCIGNLRSGIEARDTHGNLGRSLSAVHHSIGCAFAYGLLHADLGAVAGVQGTVRPSRCVVC